jgi:hypothetical protein
MSIENITTTAQRFPTKSSHITKIIIGNRQPNGVIIAKRIYYEVYIEGKKLIAIDWISAIASLYDYEESQRQQ